MNREQLPPLAVDQPTNIQIAGGILLRRLYRWIFRIDKTTLQSESPKTDIVESHTERSHNPNIVSNQDPLPQPPSNPLGNID